MEPENTPLEKDTHLQTTNFLDSMLVLGVVSGMFCFTWEAEQAKSHWDPFNTWHSYHSAAPFNIAHPPEKNRKSSSSSIFQIFRIWLSTTEAWATFQSAEIAHHFVRVIHDQHLHLGS